MSDILPDDVLHYALTFVLDVPDADFTNAEPTSPFALRQYSTSDILLVCKQWMRTGTPLLYRTAVIRSVAQAEALARTLHTNPDLNKLLRKDSDSRRRQLSEYTSMCSLGSLSLTSTYQRSAPSR